MTANVLCCASVRERQHAVYYLRLVECEIHLSKKLSWKMCLTYCCVGADTEFRNVESINNSDVTLGNEDFMRVIY